MRRVFLTMKCDKYIGKLNLKIKPIEHKILNIKKC